MPPLGKIRDDMGKQMKCRNEDCADHDDSRSGCDENHFDIIDRCSTYAKILPLWEFQDKWENKTKGGFEYKITENFNGDYFGRVRNGYCWVGVRWNESGNCPAIPKYDLSPKMEEPKLEIPQCYGFLNPKGKLTFFSTKKEDCPEGWKAVKLDIG